jgi:glycine cleavage system H protein
MNFPDDLKYAESHEWVRVESDGTLTVGITEHAQESLGDIVDLELPAVGKAAKAGEEVASVESVKAASDIHAPVEGAVIASNADAKSEPGKVNSDPYAPGFLSSSPRMSATSTGS